MRAIGKSTADYEAWLDKQTDLSQKLLDRKHRKMSDGAFPFLRATFYRWVEQWPVCCPELAGRSADVLLAVGDLHLENFGIWLDSRERLVWGMNDFDEACDLPFTSDLVRLVTSARLAREEARLVTPDDELPALFLEGYRACLEEGGQPVLLAGAAPSLPFSIPSGLPEDAEEFWAKKLDDEDSPIMAEEDLDPQVAELFRVSYPEGSEPVFRSQKKPGGLGSLGRRRFTAVVESPDGRQGREIKALVPSAAYWARPRPGTRSLTASLLQRAIRDPDPYFLIQDRWMLRQLGPDAIKIELDRLPVKGRADTERDLFRAMGWETANIHLGSRRPKALQAALQELEKDDGDWLGNAAESMTTSTREDFDDWVADHPPK